MGKHKSQHNPKVTDDRSAAALAFATSLSERFMPQAPQEEEIQETEGVEAPQEVPETPEIAPQEEVVEEEVVEEKEVIEEEPEESESEKKIDILTEDLKSFKEEIGEIIDKKFDGLTDGLTKTIKDALKE